MIFQIAGHLLGCKYIGEMPLISRIKKKLNNIEIHGFGKQL